MKIAYISNSRFPSEKAQSDQIMAMCSSFAKQGHDVKLFVPDRRPIMADDPFSYYAKLKTFAFERVRCIDALKFLWLGRLGLWIQTFTFIRNLHHRLNEFKPDIVYSRELYTFAFGRVSGLHIWESHSLNSSWWAKRIMKRLHAIVTLTAASRERLVDFGVSPDRVLVEHDAVDPQLFSGALSREEARKRLGISANDFLCLYTGKFTTMGMPKGLDEAVEAVRMLRKDGKNVRLLAVGGTPEELYKMQTKREEGIEFVGHQPQSDLKNYYAAADLLLMPFPFTEHYAYYMSPLKLFEYLASGVPMIVTDLPSVREIVSDVEAYFVKPGDTIELEEKIDFVMGHYHEAQTRAKAALLLSGKFTWSERARRIIGWVQKFL
jgi:glycosyltransferase involved in cell wall biosynthesis